MPSFPISIMTDYAFAPAPHTHLPVQVAPPLPAMANLVLCEQKGISVFAYMLPVNVKGATGIGITPPHCPGGQPEVKEGMATVKVTGVPVAFIVAATQHCPKPSCVVGPALGLIIPGPANRLQVWAGGPVVGMGNANGTWFSAFKGSAWASDGSDGDVYPADTDGSDEGTDDGSADPNAPGNGLDPGADGQGQADDETTEEEDTLVAVYPYEATIVVDGLAWTPVPGVQVAIDASGEASATVDFADFVQDGQVGPFDKSIGAVTLELNIEGAQVKINADRSTVVVDGGGGGGGSGGS